jgi:type II secretory ATPase GspE/PulE/Tfp pilus assembly ATPase PilB-like protein
MRVICEHCEQESDEKDMGANARQTDEDEIWSSHICPHCNFWNFTPAVWHAEDEGLEIIDLSKLDY